MIIALHGHYEADVEDFERKIIAILDESHVDKMAMLGNTHDMKPINELTIRIMKNYPKRIIGVAFLDPREKDTPEKLKKYIKEERMHGLKLISGIGFYPNDKKIYPVYEPAFELDIPIMYHVCQVLPPHLTHIDMRQKYSHPLFLDDVGRDFPKLNIINIHAGQYFKNETLAVGNLRNLSVEISAMLDMTLFDQYIKRLMERYGPSRVMFGGPCTMDQYYKMDAHIERMLVALSKCSLTQNEVDMVMGENAKRLFKV